MLIHLIIYAVMFIIFYIFPLAFAAIGLGGGGETFNSGSYGNSGYSVGGNIVSCDKGACSGGGIASPGGAGGSTRINA